MRQNGLLTIATVLSALFMSVHVADDIVRGFEEGGLSNLLTIPILVTLLYGTLVLAGRRSGYVITLLGSLLGAGIPVIHFRAAGGVAGHGIATSSGALFFVWTLLALGVTAALASILSAQGLWRSFSSRGRRDADRNTRTAAGP